MSTLYDDKGKFFTTIISKKPVPVIIETTLGRIEGNFHIRPEDRIKDELNRSEEFIAVTDVRLFSPSGEKVMDCNFICLNREQIIWIVPVAEIQSGEKLNE